MSWTTDDLVTHARRSGWLPDASDITASMLLAWGDECIAEDFTDLLKTGGEEYGVAFVDVPLTSGVVRYRLPRRATLRTVRGITRIEGGDEWPMLETPALESWRYQSAQRAPVYRFEGDEIVLAVAPTSSTTSIRIRYYVRASTMVEVAEGARLTSAPTTTSLAVVDAPSWLAAMEESARYVDIVRGDSPFPPVYADLVAESYSSGTVTLDASTPVVVADIATNDIAGDRQDYLCRRDETCYPPLPQEMHGALSWGIVSRALESTGDQRFALAERRYRGALDRLRNSAEPRNTAGKPRLIDPGSRLRGGRYVRGWR